MIICRLGRGSGVGWGEGGGPAGLARGPRGDHPRVVRRPRPRRTAPRESTGARGRSRGATGRGRPDTAPSPFRCIPRGEGGGVGLYPTLTHRTSQAARSSATPEGGALEPVCRGGGGVEVRDCLRFGNVPQSPERAPCSPSELPGPLRRWPRPPRHPCTAPGGGIATADPAQAIDEEGEGGVRGRTKRLCA